MPLSDNYFSLFADFEHETKRFNAGELIFSEGDEGREFYVIGSGTVSIKLGERVIETLEPNAIFGEMALIDFEPRSATAQAVTDVELVPITQKRFLYLVSEAPFFAVNVMRVMAERLRGRMRS